MADALLIDKIDGDRLALAAAGAWTSANAGALERQIDAAARQYNAVRQVGIDMVAGLSKK